MIKLPGYEITEQLYEGERSLVFRGKRSHDRFPVIIKVHATGRNGPSYGERFRREFEIGQSLCDSHIIKYYAIEPFQLGLAIIQEDFGAIGLARNFPEQGLTSKKFLHIACQLAAGVNAIHRQNIIHKDIKPDNIVINTENQSVKLIDFGIASRVNKETPRALNPEKLEGTLAYMSPEQTGRMGRPMDYRTDFYSLGVTFYELLCGRFPFDTRDPVELIHCHMAKNPPPPHEINATIPLALSEIVMKLMAKNAEDRYQSGHGLREDLERCREEQEQSGKITPFRLGRKDFAEAFSIPEKLYGREHELARLTKSFDRVGRGHAEVVLVSGYAGVGKTALVKELRRKTAGRGYFIMGKFDQLYRNVAYSAITQAVQELAKQTLMESEQSLKNWNTVLKSALSPNGQILIDLIPELELIIGRQSPVEHMGPAESRNRFHKVFHALIRAYTRKDHPLVLFLDDLQWADSSSLNLIKALMIETDLRHCLIIGGYRDNEVDAYHPTVTAGEEIENADVPVNKMQLQPLTQGDIDHWIAETLSSQPEETSTLSELVYGKTGGNPFFVRTFLQSLYEEKLLTFVLGRGWTWDMEKINQEKATENVADSIVQKMKVLPDTVRETLKIGACLGAKFSLETLVLVTEKEPDTLFADLRVALEAGMLLQNDTVFSFVHDRVQEAAYSLIPERDKEKFHLTIGQGLLQNTLVEELPARIFDIVDHLNLGLDAIEDTDERVRMARLNLMAGKKLKEANSYNSSLRYLTAGMACLPTLGAWDYEYQLALTLHQERAEVEYLTGNFEQAELLTHRAIFQAKSHVEKAELYPLIISLATLKGQYAEAVEAGAKTLELLGFHVPLKDTAEHISEQMDLVLDSLDNRDPRELLDLPKLKNREKAVAVKLLITMEPGAKFLSSELAHFIILQAVNISLTDGITPESAYAFARYGIMIGIATGDYHLGAEFGDLALKMSERFHDLKQQSRTRFVLGSNINHWVKPLNQSRSMLAEAYHAGQESCEPQFAGYALGLKLVAEFSMGVNLEQILAELESHPHFAQNTQNQMVIDILGALQAVTLNLSGHTQGTPDFHPVEPGNDAGVTRLFDNHGSTVASAVYFVFQMQIAYLCHELKEANRFAHKASALLPLIRGMILEADFNFYQSLILAEQYPTQNENEKTAARFKLDTNQHQLKIWADHCPINFQHKYLLVAAEIARITGEYQDAMDLYDRAINAAQESECVRDKALGNELAARFWLSKDKEKIARVYIAEAYYDYLSWGAQRKIESLNETHPSLLRSVSALGSRAARASMGGSASTGGSGDALDLATVTKATQAISREIKREELLKQIMKIILQNAGAQKGFLIFKTNNRLQIEVAADANSGHVEVRGGALLNDSEELSEAIVRHVFRSGESLVLHDAGKEGAFVDDPHIVAFQPKSILCTPIRLKDEISGVLYLVNNITASAFNESRIKVLNILVAQTAISLENASLYESLQKEIEERIAVENSLRENHEFIRAILDNSPAVVYVKDREGRFQHVNPRYENAFFVRNDEIVGLTDYDLFPTEMADVYREHDRIVLDSNKPHEWEEVIPHEDGLHTYLSLKFPIFDKQGKVTSVCGISTDITKRKKTEAELERYKHHLEELVEERTAKLKETQAQLMAASREVGMAEVATSVLHNVGNVLNSVNVTVQLIDDKIHKSKLTRLLKVVELMEKHDDDLGTFITQDEHGKLLPIYLRKLSAALSEEQQEILHQIEELTRHIEHIKTIVSMQQTHARVSGVTEPCKLSDLMENALAINWAGLERRQVRIIRDFEEIPVVTVDKHRILQILVNLIGNAKYAVDGTRDNEAKIILSLKRRTQNMVAMAVEDNGIGISQENLTRIFSHGFTTRKDGHGFGLHSSALAAEEMGGSLLVHSEGPGKGARFTLEAPISHMKPNRKIEEKTEKIAAHED